MLFIQRGIVKLYTCTHEMTYGGHDALFDLLYTTSEVRLCVDFLACSKVESVITFFSNFVIELRPCID